MLHYKTYCKPLVNHGHSRFSTEDLRVWHFFMLTSLSIHVFPLRKPDFYALTLEILFWLSHWIDRALFNYFIIFCWFITPQSRGKLENTHTQAHTMIDPLPTMNQGLGLVWWDFVHAATIPPYCIPCPLTRVPGGNRYTCLLYIICDWFFCILSCCSSPIRFLTPYSFLWSTNITRNINMVDKNSEKSKKEKLEQHNLQTITRSRKYFTPAKISLYPTRKHMILSRMQRAVSVTKYNAFLRRNENTE